MIGATAFAACERCGWTVSLDVTPDTALQVARELARLVTAHASTAHPGTRLATVFLDSFPQAES